MKAEQAHTGVLPVEAESLRLQAGERVLLDIASLRLEGSGCTAIIGPNGAGKSLLIRVLAGLRTPQRGTITWHGTAPDRARQLQVGLLLQRPVLLRRSTRGNLVYALRAAGRSAAQALQQAEAALDQARLLQQANSPARRLSGGEQQRLALIRALLLQPSILFLDEPTASIDPVSTLPIEALLHQAVDEGVRVVIVSHDPGQVQRLANDVILMNHGRIVEHSNCEQFFSAPVSSEGQAYVAGKLLL